MRDLFPQHVARLDRFLLETDYELVTDPPQEEIDSNSRLVRDLSDVAIALAAIAAKADYLVSEDKLVITHILLAQLDSADLSPVSVHESRLKPTCRARPKGFHALSKRL
jgi:hypothetical protein